VTWNKVSQPSFHRTDLKMSTAPASRNISELLVAWGSGDQAALDQLTPLIYDELHRLARRHMRREWPGHTLQTSALVNEAYLKLVDQNVRWQNRSHFFGLAAQLMRRILVDHARSRARHKRGGDAQRVALAATAVVSQVGTVDLVAIDDALSRLSEFDPEKARIVEMKFFGGLGVEEIARVLKVSSRTVEREWRKARAWLKRELA
jgi:RNA polymerase sigma factor (TIGR02999 family)